MPFFEREQIRFALGGGFALQALGRSRLTFDLDLIVDGSAQDRIVGHMEEIGFETLNRLRGYSNHLRGDQHVDFLYVHGDTADRIFRGAAPMESTGGISVPVARPEHLAMMKFLAVKNQHAEGLPNLEFDLPITPEDSKYLASLEPPHLTWDEYVRAVDELNRQWGPYRGITTWDEVFEI